MSEPNPWPQAADRLAARVNTRARIGAFLAGVGPAAFAGGVAAVTARLLGAPPATVGTLMAVALGIGFGVGVTRLAHVRRVPPGAAAWAMDRLHGQGEHGLAAATAGAAASQAAANAQPPPRVRMRPPTGLGWLAAGALTAAVAWLAPMPAQGNTGSPPDPLHETRSQAGAPGGAPTQDPARTLRTVAKVRQALGLTPDGPMAPETLAQRLRDPKARAKAREAARGAPDVAKFLEDNAADTRAAQGLLQTHDTAARAAEQARRQGGAARLRESHRIPAHRRGVVNRYLDRLGS